MPAALMETVFLANHCILQGFEDPAKAAKYAEKFGTQVEEILPMFAEIKLKVLSHNKEFGYYVVKIPELENLKPMSEVEEAKEAEIEKLKAQLAKLQSGN